MSDNTVDGNTLLARNLYQSGVRFAYGVVGIPVTRLSYCLQQEGIKFYAFRNEQAAGYAAAASGYLTGVPAVLLTVSGLFFCSFVVNKLFILVQVQEWFMGWLD
jgi:2-hydroxyacyl-CoA lyase 1